MALSAFLAIVAMLGVAAAQTVGQDGQPIVYPYKCPLYLNNWLTRRNDKGHKLEVLSNSDTTFNGTGIFPNMFLSRTTLAPCGVRSMHTHANVDEMIFVVSGAVAASTAWPNGTICDEPYITAGQAYLYPRNLVHSARNPSCTTPAVILGFFTAFDTATVNVVAAANNMPGGPFRPYTAPNRVADVVAATDTLVYDPYCLSECGLGPKFGQNPVKLPSRG